MAKIMTLLYHRVKPYINDIQALCVSPDNFYKQIEWLKKNYNIVRFDDDWESINDDSVCITFDDGYRDNFKIAIPILEELNVPATIFITTGKIGSKEEMWWDELERNLLLEKKYDNSFYLNDPIFGVEFSTYDYEHREDVYYSLHWLMRDFVDVDSRENWLMQLRYWNKYNTTGREDNWLCQEEDLLMVNSKLISLGAHTVNHPSLAQLDYGSQEYEISHSKSKLEHILNRQVTTFSYPFGTKKDYTNDTLEICKKIGFKKVASNFEGIWDNSSDNYQIPRYIIRDWSEKEFQNSITEFWSR